MQGSTEIIEGHCIHCEEWVQIIDGKFLGCSGDCLHELKEDES